MFEGFKSPSSPSSEWKNFQTLDQSDSRACEFNTKSKENGSDKKKKHFTTVSLGSKMKFHQV